jgi:D-mannonate dehydratase
MIKIAEALWSPEPSRLSRLCSQAGVEHAVGGLPVVEAAGAVPLSNPGTFYLCCASLRADHVPTVDGDTNEHPGYSAYGRLYALGCIRALCQAAWRS